ncbi:iron-containing alcohol dehydrogenase [Candidatus Epulonipiscium viviparus]|uniref:iron-containing alcohol dehydrogenase n=1 Tax=Candidatus Epulonipiscium viviparus TaxID=420336 RepID=UPI00273813E6|nr:iron-containing alcohol dehydrogenase [Candidatus Epulopiscium viviparus]
MNFSYYMPTKIFFGPDSLDNLAQLALPEGKALIVTGGTSTTRLGYVDRVKNLLQEAGRESIVYDKVQPNPTVESVREASKIARENQCGFIVGLGGGSSLDAAKAVAIMCTNDGDLWDYIGSGTGLGNPMKEMPLPMIAITTTAGTGTEADPWMVITNGKEKIGFGDFDKTFPLYSIVDPKLMVSIPAHLTAYQGFDALFHSLEGYIANTANVMSDLFALESIKLVGKYLPIAVKNPEDIEARGYVALANTYAGFVESLSSCTSEHSIEHALSGFHHALPHGAGLIMVSLAYFEFFNKVVPDRMIDMAKALGNENGDIVEALASLQKACGVDNLKMSEFGIVKELFAEYAKHAQEDMPGLFATDRCQLTTEDIIEILEKSFR